MWTRLESQSQGACGVSRERGVGLRPGATALSLLSTPLNIHVLRALEDEELSLADLNKAVGHPPATTMRAYLKALTDFGAVERRQEVDFPGSVSYALTEAGRRLLATAAVLQHWLTAAPDGPAALGSPAAKSAIKALVDGWDATIVRVLATRPFALTELARLIPSISYPTLERRIAAMRRVGLLEAERNGNGSRGTPYKATRWLRQAAAPLTAAIAWERRWAPAQTSMIGRIDVEASFLLAVPLLELPEGLSGCCRLAVEMRTESKLGYAGVMVTVKAGSLVSCSASLKGEPDAWATGTALDWFGWVNGHVDHQLELGGDTALARTVTEALREVLLPVAYVRVSQ
jgi:DNA-binding HxlR family transcriptional regulator